MSIKKSMLALAVAAMATMAFASSAMATDGKFRDVTGTAEMGVNRELHAVGWAKFTTAKGSYTCHVTSIVKSSSSSSTSASTGTVTKFDVPDTTKCTGTGLLNGCKLKAHKPENLPWHVTVTDNGRIDITGNIVIHIEYSSCLAPTVTLTFDEIQLTALGTKNKRTVTGTENRIGDTAALNEEIAGFEIDSSKVDEVPGPVTKGTAHVKDPFGGETTEEATPTGEFELTDADRCTWEISAS